VNKVPKSTPHSDLDGVHEDRRHVVESALEAGEDIGDVERARRKSAGRPSNISDSTPE
jgi:hypothetical protein